MVPTRHHHPSALHHRVGCPAATRSDSRRVRRGGLSRMAPPGAHAGHDHPVLPVTDAARQHRLSAICPMCRAYGSARQPTVKPAPNSRGASSRSSSSASERRCSDPPWTKGGGMAIARFWSMARGARCPILRPCQEAFGPTDGAAARVWLSRGTPPGAVPCGHRCAPEAGRRAPPHPRSRPGAAGAPPVSTR